MFVSSVIDCGFDTHYVNFSVFGNISAAEGSAL